MQLPCSFPIPDNPIPPSLPLSEEQGHHLRRICACPCSDSHLALPSCTSELLRLEKPSEDIPSCVPRCHIPTAVKSLQGWGHGWTTLSMKKYSPISQLNIP